jgi:hypothetical protein
MGVISIHKSESIVAIEPLLAKVTSGGLYHDLLVPKKLRHSQFGGLASLIQFLFTWSAHNLTGRIVTHIATEAEIDTQLEHLSHTDHGLVALLLGHDILDRRARRPLALRANHYANLRLRAMLEDGLEASRRGPKVFLLCDDFRKGDFLPSLYYPTSSPEPIVRTEVDFQLLASELLKHTAYFNYTPAPFSPLIEEQMGTILYELFKNTHEWARTDETGNEIAHSLRGIRFELHAGTRAVFLQHVFGSQVLETYLSHRPFCDADTKLRFVEISVFDSGPGLASRWLRRPIDIHEPLIEEYQAILTCLSRHRTSGPGTHRGKGLHNVMRTLSAVGGFLRIRTGRLSLQRDFIAHPYDRPMDEDGRGNAGCTKEPFLIDWDGSQNTPNSRAPVRGLLVTMLLPVATRKD